MWFQTFMSLLQTELSAQHCPLSVLESIYKDRQIDSGCRRGMLMEINCLKKQNVLYLQLGYSFNNCGHFLNKYYFSFK